MRNEESGVIENRAGPGSGHPRGVAGRAGRRIGSGNVIWDRRAIGLRVGVVRRMAGSPR